MKENEKSALENELMKKIQDTIDFWNKGKLSDKEMLRKLRELYKRAKQARLNHPLNC